MVELAKVIEPLDGPRGPDAELVLEIEPRWLNPQQVLVISVPKKLTCAACHGGGCDRCDRSGALVVALDEEESVTLTLPAGPFEQECRVRLPGYGAPGVVEDQSRGHLLLTLRASSPGSSRVRLGAPLPGLSLEERRQLIRRSVIMAVLLGLTFVGLLRLSGWI